MKDSGRKITALSLIMPCYNEAGVIEASIRKVIGFLDAQDINFEILVGNDGSTDATIDVVERIGEEDDRVKLFSHQVNKGKGAILSSTFPLAKNGILAFMDADLEIDAHYLMPLLWMVENGADIAIGSKSLAHSQRSWRRRTATLGYNILVRLLLNSKLSDHQAGIKAFKRGVLMDILSDISNDGWTWDTEILVRAQKKGYTIGECPVRVSQKPKSSVSVIKHSIQMAKDIFIMYMKHLRINGIDTREKIIHCIYQDKQF